MYGGMIPYRQTLSNVGMFFVEDLFSLSQVQIPRFLSTQTRGYVKLCGFYDVL